MFVLNTVLNYILLLHDALNGRGEGKDACGPLYLLTHFSSENWLKYKSHEMPLGAMGLMTV